MENNPNDNISDLPTTNAAEPTPPSATLNIFNIPNFFNNANFNLAQSTIVPNTTEAPRTNPKASPNSGSAYTSIFSKPPSTSSTNASHISAQTSIFGNVSSSTSNLTSPNSAHSSIFGNVSKNLGNLRSHVTAQTSIFGKLTTKNSNTNTNLNQPPTPSPEVDVNAINSSPSPSLSPPSNPEPEPDPETAIPSSSSNENENPTNSNRNRSPSLSPSPSSSATSTLSRSPTPIPDFNAPATSFPEILPPPSSQTHFHSHSHSHSLYHLPTKPTMPTSLRSFGLMFNSTKRTAALKGQAQRVGHVGADRDDSGTYDPRLEGKGTRTPRNPRSTRITRGRGEKSKENKENGARDAGEGGDGGEATPKTGVGTSTGTRSGRKTKETGSFQLLVTIKLTSEEGLEYLRGITPGVQGQGAERKISSINADEVDDEGSENEDEDVEYTLHSTRRKRVKTEHNQRTDNLTLSTLTPGHPQRRGCVTCFLSSDDSCSLITHSHEWPCESCEDAGVDCELIVPPKLKLSCIHCKEKLRKRCSYAGDGGRGKEKCEACSEAGVKCVAGPRMEKGMRGGMEGGVGSLRIEDVLRGIEERKEREREKLAAKEKEKEKLGKKAENDKKEASIKKADSNEKDESNKKVESGKKAPVVTPTPARTPNSSPTPTITTTTKEKPKAAPRKYVSCNRCRELFKGKCSLKREDEGPCSRCKKANLPCLFIALPPTPAPIAIPVPVSIPIFSTPPLTNNNSNDNDNDKEKGRCKSKSKSAEKETQKRVEREAANRRGKKPAPVLRTPQDLTQTIILESTRLNDRVWRTTHPKARLTKSQQKAYERAQSSQSNTSYPDTRFMHQTPTPQFRNTSLARRTSYPNITTPRSLPHDFFITHNGIKTIRIETAFAHPLIFNYQRDPLNLHPPCTFHAHGPFFGLFGYGFRVVTVTPWPSITGAGYEEIEDGHGDEGHPQTRMCVKCTYARVKILGCEEHQMRGLEGVDERMWNEELVRDSVRACQEGAEKGKWGIEGRGEEPEVGTRADLIWRAKWCSVCPSPGAWVCGDGGRGSVGQRGSGMGSKGCGLILCDTCRDLHAKVQKGGRKVGGRAVLGRVIQLAGDENHRLDYPDGVRADAGLLREDGELFVRWQRGGCGPSKGEADECMRESRGIGGKGVGLGMGMQVRGGFDGVNSSGGSRDSSISVGEKWKGKSVDQAKVVCPVHTSAREHAIPAREWKGKAANTVQSEQRRILDSVAVSKGEVVGDSIASMANIPKFQGKESANFRSKELSDVDKDSEDEVVKRGMGDDGSRNRRWKGKGVDRSEYGNVNADIVMRGGEDEVMQSVEKEWENKEIIELSD